jgi:pyruvate dehydrogenase E2 component (dihydrolipoamide acetyltransferase)
MPTEPAPETETKTEFPPPESVSPGSADDVFAAPVVRRRARELGIDLNAVIGSGPGGRILLADLKPAATEAERETLWKSAAEKAKERPDEKSDQAAMKDAQRATPETTQVLSRMRMAIARTVSESWRTIPHFSVTVEVRMDTAERFRDRLKEDGSDVSITALLIKATAQALTGFPRLNASLQEAQLVVHPEVNIGVVVRRDDGLLVPVLRDCANLSLAETAQRASQLVERARNGQLSHTELSGGTFAISNLGMYQVHSFVALILPPMAAVLAVGAVRDGVIAEAGQPIVARLLSLTLSADHRVVDGVYAAEFLQQLKLLLETPERLAGSQKFA